MQVGIVGKPNAGKSTFFSAATLNDVAIANYPFTTIKPSHGVTYLRTQCVCTALGVSDTPRNSKCIDGERFIPVDLVDLPGLVPGASEGRGLGNQFLDEVRKADALIHVVDTSGSTDSEGKLVAMGNHNPQDDVLFLDRELELWILQFLKKEWDKIARRTDFSPEDLVEALSDRLSGLGVKKSDIENALEQENLSPKPSQWSGEDLRHLVSSLRKSSKPVLIAANKVDLPSSPPNLEKLRSSAIITIPVCAEAELALRRAAEKGLIAYKPGDEGFLPRAGALTPEQAAALDMINQRVLKPYGNTGVQDCINDAFFRLLNMIVVYPVEDPEKMTDHAGNILPDAFLVRKGTNLGQLALKIHKELGESFLYGLNARDGMRLGESYILKNGDVVSIVSAARRR